MYSLEIKHGWKPFSQVVFPLEFIFKERVSQLAMFDDRNVFAEIMLDGQ